MPLSDPTQRFSSRVENYVRYRPGYPHGIIDLLKSECGLTTESVIADIASGTGIFTRLLLGNGNRVFGVEPNPDMRQAGEEYLAEFPKFTSVLGTAEATGLPDHSVDFVTAAQAAHWFDREKARQEFVRILKAGGWAVMIWNERRHQASAFHRAYEELLLKYSIDYKEVRHEGARQEIGEFFAPAPYKEGVFDMPQEFDYAGLEGRLLSSSYAPLPGHPNYAAMMEGLARVFAEHQRNGRVVMEHDTRVYYGRLG
jgi:ubiquinone/menaquinone biosynthesis C-methylase UbiE